MRPSKSPLGVKWLPPSSISFFIFAISGYVVASITGNTTDEGFDLKGGPAFIVFAIIILYFFLFRRYLGGTIFQRLLRAR
jgi:hypothetical protein